MREIVFDTETTGLDLKKGDRMVEIGCVEMIDRMPSGATFHAYYNPERDMPAEAEAVHGLSAQFLSDKPLFADGAQDLLDFLGEAPLVAHNASFDFGFLNGELNLCGRDPVDMGRMVDTVIMARRKFPGAKVSLDALCTRFGVDRSHRVKHGALLDAELLAQVYLELTGGRQIGLELAAQDAAETSQRAEVIQRPTQRVIRPARPHSASDEELSRHRAFLEKITKPIWAG